MRFIYLAHFTPRGRGLKPKTSLTRLNHRITAKEIRVVDDDGNMLGIMPTREGIRIAMERELDLVEIAPKAKPPVCKIIDFGKYQYELQKKEKYQRKQQQQQQMKEIRFKWRTDTHDFNFKARHAERFLKDGNKVKASVMFRGREITHKEIGRELLERFVEKLRGIGNVDQHIRSEGKFMSVILSPEKSIIKTKKINS